MLNLKIRCAGTQAKQEVQPGRNGYALLYVQHVIADSRADCIARRFNGRFSEINEAPQRRRNAAGARCAAQHWRSLKKAVL
jgi:hypothetical protein